MNLDGSSPNPWCAEKHIVTATHLSQFFIHSTGTDGTLLYTSSSPLLRTLIADLLLCRSKMTTSAFFFFADAHGLTAEGDCATDDESGKSIAASEVRAARKEETEFMNEIQLSEDSTSEDCWSSTGKPPVSTKWIDSKKGEGRQQGQGLLVRIHTAAGRDQGGAG